MILFENSLIKLDYNPATDILEVAYPDLHGYLIPEIKNSINKLIDSIKNYDVKKVLLDSSRTVVSITEEESQEITTYLASGLAITRLQKLARVQSPSATVEKTAQKNVEHVKEAGLVPFQLQNFSSKSEAVNWLLN